jgi:hypothetical protein
MRCEEFGTDIKPWISWPNVSELLRRGRPITDESEFPQPHRH